MKSSDDSPKILILEDDPDQMALLIDFVLSEVKKIADDLNTSPAQEQTLQSIKLIKVSNTGSLEKAVSVHKGIILAILDCNSPDKSGGVAHDQLIKTNHRITGQHKAVDILTQHSPTASIIMTSSLNRFRKIIFQYYESQHDLSVRFVRKSNPDKLRRYIASHLQEHLMTRH